VANRLQALKQQKAALVARMRATLEFMEKEGRELSAEEDLEYKGHETNLAALDSKIGREEKLQEIERIAKLGPADDEEHGPKIGQVREAWAKDPKRGFSNPREFLMSVLEAGKKGFVRDERLKSLAAPIEDGPTRSFMTAGSDEQGAYSDPYGGFLVPKGFSPTLLQLAPEDDPIAGRVTQVPLTAPSVSFNARVDKDHTTSVSGGLVVTRRAETQTQTASRMTFEQIELKATSLFGLAYATQEILTDSPISFAAMLEAGFRDQFSSHLIGERLSGTGVGEFVGVLKCGCLISVDKETGQEAASIVYENLIKMRSRCWRYSDAVWMYNHDCLPQLMSLVMPIGTGARRSPASTARPWGPRAT